MVRSAMTDAVSLRERRRALLETPALRGADFSAALAAEADRWLAAVSTRAARGRAEQVALLAVGSYGRREPSPYSDLDLVLVHDGRRAVTELAEAIWYPVWDDGMTLDHSVRRPHEVLAAAAGDLRVALGLLDGRRIWGDEEIAARLLTEARTQWRTSQGDAWLALLVAQMSARSARYGDLAFLLEPDLKEARGGLRDALALHAIAAAVPDLRPSMNLDDVDAAARVLLGVRVELQRVAGRALDRLVLQDQDQVATALGYADADALMADVAAAGRTIAWACTEALSRHHRWEAAGGRRGRPSAQSGRQDPTVVEPGIVLALGEVDLDANAPVATDPALPLRLAAAAAEHGASIAPGALQTLAASSSVPDPWPDSMREALVRALAAGPPAVVALEALDQAGLLVRLIPEWSLVRNRPQRNAYHRYTVDRHLLEAAAEAAALAGGVSRPDLLLVGCLLHDIGKGMPGDHTDAGVVLVDRVARRMGFPEADVAELVALCRHHLLLADVATRRDLEDPVTVAAVCRALGNPHTLHLLAALTEADSLATGPAAWGPWKAALVAELVDRVDRSLAGLPAPAAPPHPAAQHATLAAAVRANGRPAIRMDPPRLVVAALDRLGLLASVTGVLALHGLDVRQADISSVEGVAVEEFAIETERERWPDPAQVLSDLDAVLAGRMDLAARLATRAADYAGARRPRAARPARPSVEIDVEASVASTVVDVHTGDQVGLLHQLALALARCELDVVSARATTVGDTVTDAFYVRDAEGRKITEPSALQRIEQAIIAALTDP